MKAFAAALGFLSRIPVPVSVFADSRARRHSVLYYPLVGALLGTLLALLYALLADFLPNLLLAAIILLAWVWLTGGLHLDGLADSADAWAGGIGDRKKTLAIMKDPTSGPAGVAALHLVLLLKFAALASLPEAPVVLFLAVFAGRLLLLPALLTTAYVRADGLGSGLAPTPWVGWLITLLALPVLAILPPSLALSLLAGLLLVFWRWRSACIKRLGGTTGDTLGALVEITETSVLVLCVALGPYLPQIRY
ncbi:adenosylcobinamide-GDP ribazoletransferase [Lysobacteraceae bacterium NML120232]|nr:adenosylcobinamide-GDP ribazoletransferase [Xanthomonadaceae bacterium NML08-0793]PJK13471.1 adenosylcobinamide-GDP ribazoletransferase [Xanthomonadaceae bacterium NML120232]